MKLITFLGIGSIFLDVAVFPHSCSNNYYNERSNLAIFDYSLEINEGYVRQQIKEKLPKDRLIFLPEEIVSTYEDQQIAYWTLIDQEEPITFPYEYKDEDVRGYFEGNRQSVVFIAHWETITNE